MDQATCQSHESIPHSEQAIHAWTDVIREFTPAWFAASMGTGAVSILFHAFPYGHSTQTLDVISLVIFFINLLLLLFFSAITVTRFILYPHTWSLMLQHPLHGLYMGCFPMAVTTLINVGVEVINKDYNFGGKPFLYFLWGIWWIDVALSVVCCWGTVHYMQTSQDHALERMTSAWLFPVVTLIVASSSGGVLSLALQKYSVHHAIVSAASAAFLVTVGLTLALMILTVYLHRLIVHGLPAGPAIISVFLPLGPTGQSGYSILLIGQSFKAVMPLSNSPSPFFDSGVAGQVIDIVCTCISFVMWSLASMWLIFGLLAVVDTRRRSSIPFKLAFWGLVFPNGVYANLTISLSRVFDSSALRIYGSIYAVLTVVLWLSISARTLMAVPNRKIFEPLGLQNVKQNEKVGFTRRTDTNDTSLA